MFMFIQEMKFKFIMISTFFQSILMILLEHDSIIGDIFMGIIAWISLMLFFIVVEIILRIDFLSKILLWFYKLFWIVSLLIFIPSLLKGLEGLLIWLFLVTFLYTFFKLADMEINHSDPWEFIPIFKSKTSTSSTPTYTPPSYTFTPSPTPPPTPKHTTPPKKTHKPTHHKKKKSKKLNIAKCVNCGKEIENPTSNICPYCGKDIYKKQTNLIKCPKCGQEYSSDESFCPFCGTPKP